MYILAFAIGCLLLDMAAAAPAAAALQNRATCARPGQRKAWHKLNETEKKSYIDAELCLMNKPAKLGRLGARTRFDDFQAIHQNQSYMIHFVGAFLPFHRLLLHLHEQALQNECNYKGYQPYWAESIDSGNFSNSVVFDPVTGFGGNGSEPSLCLTDGPFKNYTVSLGPGYLATKHCLKRKIDDLLSDNANDYYVQICMEYPTFEDAWACFENSPHIGGHAGTGGEMNNPVSSPGDPIFYLHHAWLDKLWWNWQAKDLKKRLTDISGSNIMEDGHPMPPTPDYIPVQTGAPGDPGNMTTLKHILNTYGEVKKNITIADVMDVRATYLCYNYVEP